MNTLLTTEQLKGMGDRVATVFATWLVTYLVNKGIIAPGDAVALIAQIGPVFIGAGALIWGWWVNRNKALVQAAAAIPNTVVVTEHALAASTPEPNIVSAATAAVVAKI